MNILGFTGGFDPLHRSKYGFTIDFLHDAAAALVQGGQVVAAIEEERLNRIKHTNKAPVQAIRFCLEQGGLSLDQVDRFAFYATEEFLNGWLRRLHLDNPALGPFTDIRTRLQDVFEQAFSVRPPAEKFAFVSHHMSHAVSALAMCGFDDCLVLSMDGVGESVSTMVLSGFGKELRVLNSKPQQYSLGNYYLRVIGFLGYRIYDEYKVMGLAPYGDPSRFRSLFDQFYALLPGGDYVIYSECIMKLYEVLSPRQRGEAFSQLHMDIAAALQESLENIVFHMLEHYREVTGHKHLAVAGGVGQNSSMMGKLWGLGMFEDIFVQPAADDSGCALGCALAVAHQLEPELPVPRVQHVYWGKDVGSDAEIEAALRGWSPLVEMRKLDDVSGEVARLLAGGAVAGWVQGRCEYGPRSLGNRSIIADPRPAANKDRVNAMIKKREGYRPFAPSILEERVGEFFEIPDTQKKFPFMSCVLNVRQAWRQQLGAITHVDGSARLQTVSAITNPRFHALIDAFDKLTGVPIVLNTSFNNNVEPIVTTTDEAVTCFLTSGLDILVVGDWLVTKKPFNAQAWSGLRMWLSPCALARAEHAFVGDGRQATEHRLVRNYDATLQRTLSADAFRAIQAADEKLTIAGLLGTDDKPQALLDELFSLWDQRWIVVRP